jgi:hypothetical protein
MSLSLILALFAGTFWLAAVPIDNVIYLVRVLQIAFVLVLIGLVRFRLRKIEMTRAFLVAAGFLIQPLAVLFLGQDVEGTLPDLARQGYAAVLLIAVVAAVISRREEKIMMASLGICAIAAGFVCAYLLYSNAGLSGLTYLRLKELKYSLAEAGIPLNGLAFSVSATLLLAGVWYRPTPIRLRLCLAAALAVTAVFGSTTALISFAGAVVLAYLFMVFGTGRIMGSRFVAASAAVASVGAMYGAVLYLSGEAWLLELVNEATVGRAYLWLAAIEQFVSEPILGTGAMSWKSDLLPAISSLTDQRRYEYMSSGAYHSVPLTTAAERGLVGLGALIAVHYLLIRTMTDIARRARHNQNGEYRTKAVAGLIVCLFMMLRGTAEYTGYFAYANSHGDLLSIFFVAILMRLLSENEVPAPLRGLARRVN